MDNKMNKLEKKITSLLIFLIALDVTISIGAFFFPDLWFRIFHGVPYNDPQGFLRRCGANWGAFALFQIIALVKWKKRPYWLAIVAGIRFSDIFTDWTYLFFSSDITMFGRVSLFAVSPLNVLFGLYFLYAFGKLRKWDQQ